MKAELGITTGLDYSMLQEMISTMLYQFQRHNSKNDLKLHVMNMIIKWHIFVQYQ